METSAGWWLPQLRAEVSQGDVIASVPFLIATVPIAYLQYTDGAKGKPCWAETDAPVIQKKTQRMHALGAFVPRNGIILSHDCEIDKAKERPRMLFAPVALISDLPPETQTVVLAQGHLALVPLPDLPSAGMCYADLRAMTTVPSSLIDGHERLASMTDQGRARLHAYLVAFLLRKKLEGADLEG